MTALGYKLFLDKMLTNTHICDIIIANISKNTA